MTDDEFRLFRNLIYGESGLYFPESKKSFLSSRIGKRLEARSLRSFYRYYRYLEEAEDRKTELLLLLDLLTINETSFFRNRPQFQLLERFVLPEIVTAKRRNARPCLRVWSAGCSTGEEPYSIAISALEVLPQPAEWKVEIFASDLSLTALDRAARGIYSESHVKAIDKDRLARYFVRSKDGYTVGEALRRTVIFDFHNLKHENGLRELDLVFCRNVMIYFDEQEQAKVLDKFVEALLPGGYLFLGHAESVQGRRPELVFVHRDKGTAYRRIEAA